MEKYEELKKDLTCPITQELFEDPISVPCCGKAFSRVPLVQHFEHNGATCPMCRADIPHFDALHAPKNVIIAGMVESYLRLAQSVNIVPPPPPLGPPKQIWSCSASPVVNGENVTLPVSELSINLDNAEFATKPSLFIAVVDRSGSMSGSPWQQVETALLHIMSLTRSSPFVKTVIVAYDSNAEIINTSGSQADVYRVIKTMFTGGGTNFSAAFQKVKEVLGQYVCDDSNSPNNVSNITCAFLTDGQSGASDRNKLIGEFDTILKASWKGPLSIHSIGFGRDCDKELLEGLWKSGPQPGTFRYAEPSDDGDTLCNKLTSLFEVVSKSSTVTIQAKLSTGVFKSNNSAEIEIQFPVGENKKGSCTQWLLCDSAIMGNPQTLTINSPVDKDVVVPIVIKNPSPQDRKSLLNRWLSILIDELASEILELSKRDKATYGVNVFDLHCALLQQRIERIGQFVDANESERLEYLEKEVTSLRAGLAVNVGKLGDLRFSSRYLSIEPAKPREKPVALPARSPVPAITKEKEYKELTVYYSRNNTDKKRNALQEAIANNLYNKITPEIQHLLDQATESDINYTDVDGNNALMLSAYCGQSLTMKAIILRWPNINLECENLMKETAMTLAIKARGFWKCVTELMEIGATIPSHRRKALEQFAIDHKFPTTAELISNSSDDAVTVHESMTPEYIGFVYNRCLKQNKPIDVDRYLKICLSKGIVDLMEKLLCAHPVVPTLEMIMGVCIPNSLNHLKLTEMLLDRVGSKVAEFVNQTDNNGDSPLFRACEKGSLEHVKLFLAKGSHVDLPNKLGNTPLWIACWKRLPEIIQLLLDHNADPNYCNLKGNPPLVSICQKGPKQIAEMLLARGATVNHLNANGDSMILICCRNGQPDVLQLLLTQAEPAIVSHVAHIDGFSAILASTEANRPECIQVLHEYGIDIEQRTADDNAILAGATSLHLASYYGRTDAMRTLLALGANPNARDVRQQTPLHIAVIQGHSAIIKLLRNAKADLNLRDAQGNTAVAYCRNEEMRKVLINPAVGVMMRLARGEFRKEGQPQADPRSVPASSRNAEEQQDGCKVLAKHCSSLGCLTSAQAVDIVAPTGNTPLLEAIIHSNYDVVKALRELGASPDFSDLHGVSCRVWAHWIGNPRIKQLIGGDLTPADSTCLQRLNTAKSQSSHDSMILYLGSRPGQIASLESIPSGIGNRMDDFINSIFHSDTVAKFVEKAGEHYESNVKSTKVVSVLDAPGEKTDPVMETLKWNAKVFTTSIIASGIHNIPQQVMALYIYDLRSKMVNTAILNNSLDPVQSYLGHLLSALESLPPFVGETYLGANNVDRKLYTIGTEICWPVLMSASTMWRIATENVKDFSTPKKQGTVFILKSKTGRLIGQYSRSAYDMEILFSPNTRFKVVNWYYGDVICLGQANIRQHTFGIKEPDRDGMMSGNRSMIIEMEEL